LRGFEVQHEEHEGHEDQFLRIRVLPRLSAELAASHRAYSHLSDGAARRINALSSRLPDTIESFFVSFVSFVFVFTPAAAS
jgi:hypothetical protein